MEGRPALETRLTLPMAILWHPSRAPVHFPRVSSQKSFQVLSRFSRNPLPHRRMTFKMNRQLLPLQLVQIDQIQLQTKMRFSSMTEQCESSKNPSGCCRKQGRRMETKDNTPAERLTNRVEQDHSKNSASEPPPLSLVAQVLTAGTNQSKQPSLNGREQPLDLRFEGQNSAMNP